MERRPARAHDGVVPAGICARYVSQYSYSEGGENESTTQTKANTIERTTYRHIHFAERCGGKALARVPSVRDIRMVSPWKHTHTEPHSRTMHHV